MFTSGIEAQVADVANFEFEWEPMSSRAVKSRIGQQMSQVAHSAGNDMLTSEPSLTFRIELLNHPHDKKGVIVSMEGCRSQHRAQAVYE